MSRRVLLDANLLVLLVVGATSPNYIARHRRLQGYSEDDYELLIALLGPPGLNGLIATPNVLTEASNLLRQIGEPRRSDIMEQFGILLAKIAELYIPSSQAAERNEFHRLGLSDALLVTIEDDDILLLTADVPLYVAAASAGRNAENFAHHQATRL